MTDQRYMAYALSLARRGLGRTWPNPSVGCVIVKNDTIVGVGRTADGGRPHAEVVALAQAGSSAVGATAYVTLEPCSHHGKTPPCCEALVAAGISRIVSPFHDRDPRVSGAGFRYLREAGIEVETGVCTKEAYEEHLGFFLKFGEERPKVTLKLAMSADGRIATASGESKWITDTPARRLVHAMRAEHDAVLVGGGTVRDDDPSLTVRELGIDHKTVRVVLSRKLDLPRTCRLAETAKEYPVWICHSPEASEERQSFWKSRDVELIPTQVTAQRLDEKDALKRLSERGITRVFCEGGGTLAASLLQADLVDDLICFHAGLIIGAEGRPSVSAMGLETLPNAPRFDLEESRKIGPDTLQIWTRR